MKKSERLNQMLRFINQKQQFTLQDLMQEFHISKRTALRDISSLEEIGAPIYAEYGRYGGYHLLNQMTLPPFLLTVKKFMRFILQCRHYAAFQIYLFKYRFILFMRNL